MTSQTRAQVRHVLALSLAALLPLGLIGCGGDSKGPSQPGGTRPPTAFDQTTAIGQAQVAAPQAVTLVESMTTLAGGVAKDAAQSYGWNPETGRWEYEHIYSTTGYDYHWFYTVQYLDGDGAPQQFAAGAATVLHAMAGTVDYHMVQNGATIDYDYTYLYNTNITGLGTGTLTLTGTGNWDYDYTYTSPQGNFAQTFEVSWQTLGAGIVRTGGSCPIGTIRYDFPPYYSLITFDGSTTATSVLYNASGTPVPGGTTTHPVGCTAR